MYIYSHPQTDLFRSIRTHPCGLTGKIPEAEIEIRLTQTPIQDSTTQPRGSQRQQSKFKRLCIAIVIIYIYPLNGYRELDSYEEPCIYANGKTITSFARELNPKGVGEHIYIYCHPQTDLFRYIYIYIYIYPTLSPLEGCEKGLSFDQCIWSEFSVFLLLNLL